MKSFIAFALVIASVGASPGGFAYNYVAPAPAVTYAAAPAVTYAAAPAITYSAPVATSSQYRHQTVNSAVIAAPAAVAYSAPVAAAVAPAVTYAAPAVTYAAPAAVAIPAVTKTQYHAQDVLGQASFGYSYPGQAHHTVRDANGNERGSYAYINPDGNEIRVDYVADQGGFRAASNALPQAPVHVVPQAVATAPLAVFPAASVPADTPEVVEAKIAHAAAHVEARARNLVLRKKRAAVFAPAISTYAAAVPAVSTYSAALPLHHTALTYGTSFGYSTAIHHPSAAIHHPVATYAAVAPAAVAVAPATYTQVVNTPGHAVSYRVY